MDKNEIKIKIEKTKKLSKVCIIIVLLLFITILVMNFVLLYKDNEKYNIENLLTNQIIILTIIVVIINIIIYLLNKNYFKKYIRYKYNDFILKNNNKKEIIYISNATDKVGSIRHKYLYSIYLPKYNCTLNRYYEQEFKKINRIDYRTGNSHTIYKYVTIYNSLEYVFELGKNCWCTLDEVRKIIETAELLDNKIIIKRNLSKKKRITILDELDFVDDIGKIYMQLINFVYKG